MAKDYVLFLHGVNVRETPENEKKHKYTYANNLFKLIEEEVRSKDSTRNCIKVPLYWGDVNQRALDELLASLKGSSQWNQLWFRDFRTKQLLQFVGDAGLYISRLIGSMAADQLKQQAFERLEGYEPEDRLHLVTHSWEQLFCSTFCLPVGGIIQTSLATPACKQFEINFTGLGMIRNEAFGWAVFKQWVPRSPSLV